MKINRHKNRVERLIAKLIAEETRPRTRKLWGSPCDIAPAFVPDKIGDGLQVVYLEPIDTRPDYYVLRIDSRTDVTADDFNPELLICAAEEAFGDADSYEERCGDDGEWEYRVKDFYDNEPWTKEDLMKWPVVHWSGGMWGTIKNFKPTVNPLLVEL